MMARFRGLLTVIWLYTLSTIVFLDAEVLDYSTSRRSLLLSVTDNLASLVNHYSHSEGGLNVDGLFGFRIAQGAIAESITKLNLADSADHQLSSSLFELKTNLDELCDAAEKEAAKNNPEYYQSFKPLIDSAFITEPPLVSLPDAPVNDSQSRNVYSYYNEERGDKCYRRLMGTEKNNIDSYKCFIEKDCVELMTAPNQHGYSLTHQLLYFIISQKVGCGNIMDTLLVPQSTDQYQRDMCKQILYQNNQLLSLTKHLLNKSTIDIFLEQGLLCSMAGFTNFLDNDRLRVIISQQDPIGCFRHKQILRRGEMLRERRREKLDGDHCFAHTTGLAAAYMALYIQHQSNDL